MRLMAVACLASAAVLLSGVLGAELATKKAKQPGKAKASSGAKHDPAFDKVNDDPSLPRVLLIGDSISIGYTVPVRVALKGKANVHRIPVNGGPTTVGLKGLKEWLGQGHWDVIHFNWGLHDLKIMKDGKHQVPVEQYAKNLRALVNELKATKAKLIWASTTPVPEGKSTPARTKGDEVAYNAAAKKVMDENGIAVDDLCAFVTPRLAELQLPGNVHFTAKGYEALGRQVAETILPFLSKGAVAPAKSSGQ
jgi:hypothetical protein